MYSKEVGFTVYLNKESVFHVYDFSSVSCQWFIDIEDTAAEVYASISMDGDFVFFVIMDEW